MSRLTVPALTGATLTGLALGATLRLWVPALSRAESRAVLAVEAWHARRVAAYATTHRRPE